MDSSAELSLQMARVRCLVDFTGIGGAMV